MEKINAYLNGQKIGEVLDFEPPSTKKPSDCKEHLFSKTTMKCINCNKCAHEFLTEIQEKQNESLKTWEEIR